MHECNMFLECVKPFRYTTDVIFWDVFWGLFFKVWHSYLWLINHLLIKTWSGILKVWDLYFFMNCNIYRICACCTVIYAMIIYEMCFFKCIKRLSFFKQSIQSEDIVSCVFLCKSLEWLESWDGWILVSFCSCRYSFKTSLPFRLNSSLKGF